MPSEYTIEKFALSKEEKGFTVFSPKGEEDTTLPKLGAKWLSSIQLWALTYKEHQQMGTKNIPGSFDCYVNAMPDEPLFTLLARDRHAPSAVEDWADNRELEIRRGYSGNKNKVAEELKQLAEARSIAQEMRRWRTANMGAWRGALPVVPTTQDRELSAREEGFFPNTPPLLEVSSEHEYSAIELQSQNQRE